MVQSQTERSVRDWTVVGACEKLGTTIREQLPKPENQRVLGELTPAELSIAEREIIREAQGEAFSEEIGALRKNQTLP